MEDLEEHEREFSERVSFIYTLMNPEETECLGCIYIDPLEASLGDEAGSGAYLTDCTTYVTYWVRQSRLADTLDKRLLQALLPWFQNEWAFSRVLYVAQRVQQRQIQLFEEEGMQLLYTLKPRQPFLDLDLVYTFDQNLARTAKNG